MPFKSKAQLALEAAQSADPSAAPASTRREYKVVPCQSPEALELDLNKLDPDYGFLFFAPANAPHMDGYAVFVREVES